MVRRLSAALVIAILLAGPAAGQVVRATVEVQGMACPFCAFGVEKRLRKVEGVSTIEVAMAEGQATLEVREGESIDLAGIPGAVRRAGFTPGRVEAEVIGVPRREEAQTSRRWSLTADGQKILLVDTPDELAEQLAGLAQGGSAARVRGILRLPIGEHPELEPLEVEAGP
ncbi:MAG: heavy-metal-associated domain-containing protein [Thermoanaerobaculia bacterium]